MCTLVSDVSILRDKLVKLVLTNLWIYKIRFNQENDILLALASGKSIDFKVFFKK